MSMRVVWSVGNLDIELQENKITVITIENTEAYVDFLMNLNLQAEGQAGTIITEDMAAEQKARSTYENLIRLTDDPDVLDPLRFLREREIVHFQRFGEALSMIQDSLNSKNFYAFNPEFDKGCK